MNTLRLVIDLHQLKCSKMFYFLINLHEEIDKIIECTCKFWPFPEIILLFFQVARKTHRFKVLLVYGAMCGIGTGVTKCQKIVPLTVTPTHSFVFLFGLRLYVPVNNFSVMSGRSHRFLGITSTFWEVNVSCSRIQHGDPSEDRTPDLSLRSPTLYH